MIDPKKSIPQVWGHRGAMAFAPQNTVPSFLTARDQGADGVELDVQLSRDGVLVVFHDVRVDALTDGKGPVGSLTWKELRALDAGSHFGRTWAGTRIPTLEEVLEALGPGFFVNVELKTALSEEAWYDRWLTLVTGPRAISEARARLARDEARPLAEATARVLGSLDPGSFILSSFDPFALEAVTPLLPRVPRGFLHSPTVPWDTPRQVEPQVRQAWHPHHSQVTGPALDWEHSAGRKVNVWTVNDPTQAARLAGLGVDGLITNRPGDILKALGR